MYIIVKQVIESGKYELFAMLTKIDTLWVQGNLSDEQKTELVTLAQEKAKPENSYAPLQNQINELLSEVEKILTSVEEHSASIASLEDAISQLGGTVTPPETTEPEEWPEWYRWNGIGKCPWQNGSKCTHNGTQYISRVANNIWEPGGLGVYDNIWEKQE